MFFEKFAFNGLNMVPEPELVKSRERNRNRNFSNVATGTVKNSYGSIKLVSTKDAEIFVPQVLQ